MAVLAVFVLLVFSGSVLSEEVSLLVACSTNDIDCLSRSTEKFLQHTHKGIPAFNIVPIDPLFIPSFDIVFEEAGITYKNQNLTVTGLKNQKISDFKMDTTAKSVVLTTKADLEISGDITVEFTRTSKSLPPGHFTLRASVLGTATYNYELRTDDKGVEHFYVGPETITCQVVDVPKVELSSELLQASENDADIRALSQEKKIALRKQSFCKVVEKAYTQVVHNIRAAAAALPASSFFNNIH